MAKLKIVHITTFQRAGSGIAAMRLHKALSRYDYDSQFLFLSKGSQSENEKVYRKQIYLFQLLLRILKKIGLPLTLEQRNDYAIRKYKYQMELFSFANTSYKKLHEHQMIREADIIHLHFISDFIDFKTFFSQIHKPIIWTLHDMNPFLGGFHYNGDAIRFGTALQALEKEQFTHKKNALHQLPTDMVTITTPSEWLLHLSEQSDMLKRFPHVYIPNCVNINVFRYIKKAIKPNKVKRKLNVLFVAETLHNTRKGFDFILELLNDKSIIDMCSFTAVGHVKKSLCLPCIVYKGSITSEKEMSQLYNEADIFLLPSREDNLPNTMIESLCCGLPVVGFVIGGLEETITNGKNGYLSKDISSKGLKEALFACIKNLHQLNRTDIEAQAHTKYSEEAVVSQFINLYNMHFNQQNKTLQKDKNFEDKLN